MGSFRIRESCYPQWKEHDDLTLMYARNILWGPIEVKGLVEVSVLGRLLLRVCQLYMVWIHIVQRTWIKLRALDYPWKDLGNNASVCDVGCGIGTVSIALAKAHPNLQFILQDLPRRLEQAKHEVWPEKFPDALAKSRVQFVPLNFVTDVPASGCDVYYVSPFTCSIIWRFLECWKYLMNHCLAEKYYVSPLYPSTSIRGWSLLTWQTRLVWRNCHPNFVQRTKGYGTPQQGSPS